MAIALTPIVGVVIGTLCRVAGAAGAAAFTVGLWVMIAAAFVLAIIDTALMPKWVRSWRWLLLVLCPIIVAPAYLAIRNQRNRARVAWLPWVAGAGSLIVGVAVLAIVATVSDSGSTQSPSMPAESQGTSAADVASMNCATLAEQAAQLTDGSGQQPLLKVEDPRLTMDKRSTIPQIPAGSTDVSVYACRGEGIFSDGSHSPVEVTFSVDGDRDSYVGWKPVDAADTASAAPSSAQSSAAAGGCGPIQGDLDVVGRLLGKQLTTREARDVQFALQRMINYSRTVGPPLSSDLLAAGRELLVQTVGGETFGLTHDATSKLVADCVG